MAQQLVAGLHDLVDVQFQRRRNVLHMQALIGLRGLLQRLQHPPRRQANVCRRLARCSPSHRGCAPARLRLVLALLAARLGQLLHGTACKVQVHEGRFEQVVRDFHLVGDRADDVGADVAAVVESFEPAPYARPLVLGQFRFGAEDASGVVGAGAAVCVNPLFHFNGAGAVVEFVGYIGGLSGDVADLTDKSELVFQVVS